MATLTLKNFPDDLYARLKARAAENRRSLNKEGVLAVERSLTQPVSADAATLLASLRRSRARMKGVFLTDADLRDARDRGRP